MEISREQRRYLKKLAHHLDPYILIGKKGLTEDLTRALDEALGAHELVKVRFNEFKTEKKELLAEMAEATRATVVDITGHVGILFRYQHDPSKQKIALPERG